MFGSSAAISPEDSAASGSVPINRFQRTSKIHFNLKLLSVLVTKFSHSRRT